MSNAVGTNATCNPLDLYGHHFVWTGRHMSCLAEMMMTCTKKTLSDIYSHYVQMDTSRHNI